MEKINLPDGWYPYAFNGQYFCAVIGFEPIVVMYNPRKDYLDPISRRHNFPTDSQTILEWADLITNGKHETIGCDGSMTIYTHQFLVESESGRLLELASEIYSEDVDFWADDFVVGD